MLPAHAHTRGRAAGGRLSSLLRSLLRAAPPERLLRSYADPPPPDWRAGTRSQGQLATGVAPIDPSSPARLARAPGRFSASSHLTSRACLPASRLCLPVQAVRCGHDAIRTMCVAIEAWAAQVGKPKRTQDLLLPPEGLDDAVQSLIGQQVRAGVGCVGAPPCAERRGAAREGWVLQRRGGACHRFCSWWATRDVAVPFLFGGPSCCCGRIGCTGVAPPPSLYRSWRRRTAASPASRSAARWLAACGSRSRTPWWPPQRRRSSRRSRRSRTAAASGRARRAAARRRRRYSSTTLPPSAWPSR